MFQEFLEKAVKKLKYYQLLDWLPDKIYLKIMYYACMHEKLNLKNPRSFNEKLQWIKLYDRSPEYTQMVDKYEAKGYVADRIGKQYIIPTLGIWKHFDDIDFKLLPNQFVLKCTHDSGGLVICRDKNKLDLNAAKKKIEKSLSTNYYYNGREWPYKDIKPRIIAEEYMEDNGSKELIDYKFYCFGGEPRFLYVSKGLENHQTARISFVTLDWKPATFGRSDYKPFEKLPNKPQNFEKMVELARELSKGYSFLRVDLYEINGRIYFSELTFSPNAGMMPFSPKNYDYILGDMLILPKRGGESW